MKKICLLTLTIILALSTQSIAQDKGGKQYGRNILSVTPLQITNDVGVGLSYERVLDSKGILSFYLPIAVSLNSVDESVNGTINNVNDSRLFILPGLKLYPTGGNGKVRYAVGPNLAYVQGLQDETVNRRDNTGNIVGVETGKRTMVGIMVTNSLNINPTEHIHLGMELGLGFTYLNQVAGVNLNTAGLVQLGFKIGYRF